MKRNSQIKRGDFVRLLGGGIVMASPLMGAVLSMSGCTPDRSQTEGDEELFTTRFLTDSNTFTSGAEGPAVDREGNIYAVNFDRQGTIGKVTPDGEGEVFVELPDGSVANGIRFNSRGDMLLADYTNHNILQIDMESRDISVHAHQPEMNQPNDIAISANDTVYASDPNWSESTGQLWRIDTDGSTVLLDGEMGTTNGIEVSPDESRLYVNESVQRNVWMYDLSQQGEISNKQLLINFDDFGMDGMRCDVDGNLYITRHGKGTVVVVSPAGEIIREIEMAEGTSVTNLAFGGPDGRTVYVTVADTGNIQYFRADRPGRSWALYEAL